MTNSLRKTIDTSYIVGPNTTEGKDISTLQYDSMERGHGSCRSGQVVKGYLFYLGYNIAM